MSLSIRQRPARGATTSNIFALIVLGVLLLVIGYVLGRRGAPVPADSGGAGETPAIARDTPPPDDAPNAAPGDVDEPISRPATEPAQVPRPFQIEPPELDFGVIAPDTPLEGTIKITNIGDEPLHIVKQRASCQCTTVNDVSGTVLPPNGSVEVTAALDPRSWPGPKHDRITFTFANYSEPVHVELISDVSRAVRADPPFIQAVEEGQDSGEFTLTAIDDRTFRVLAVNGEDPDFVDFDPQADQPRHSYRLRWDISRFDRETCVDENGDRIPGWCVVETDHPDCPVIDLRIRNLCNLPEPIKPSGRRWLLSEMRIVLGEIKAGDPVEFTVSVGWIGRGEPTDTIRRVVTESGPFEISLIEAHREGNEIVCRVQLVPNEDHRGLLYGKCRFFAFNARHSSPLTVIGRVVE